MRPHVLAVDMGFAALGYSIIRIGPTELDDEIMELGVFTTKLSPAKRRAFVADDNIRRTAEVFEFLHGLLVGAYKPRAVAAESFSYHKGIKASAKMGLAWGALVSAVTLLKRPFLDTSPQDVKLAATGKKTATKEEVQDGVRNRFPSRPSVFAIAAPGGLHEHAFDSAGVFMAVQRSNIVKLLRPR